MIKQFTAKFACDTRIQNIIIISIQLNDALENIVKVEYIFVKRNKETKKDAVGLLQLKSHNFNDFIFQKKTCLWIVSYKYML